MCGAQHHGHRGTTGFTRSDLQLAPDTFRSLSHDRKTEPAFGTCRPNSGTVVGDLDPGVRRVISQLTQRFFAPACLRALVMASWAIRISSASTEAGSRAVESTTV